MGLFQKNAISSVKWTSLQTILSGAIGPIALIIKARFLTTEEFAYLAIITLIIGFVNLLEGFGISQAIIQRDVITKKESSSLFFFNVIFCIILAIVLILLSPFIASFFSLPLLTGYLKLVSIIVLLTGPSLLFQAFLEKQMFFKHLSLITISRNVLMLITLILFLYLGLGVKGIIYSQIIGTTFATSSIIFIAAKLKSIELEISFHPKAILPFLRFGIFVSLKHLLTYIAHRLDEIVIGYFLAPEVLGIYHFGKSMLEKMRILITNSYGKVLFPVLSKLKNNKEKLSLAYKKISQYIAFVAFPIFTGIAVTAHLFVPLVFGEQWIDSVIVFQVFSVSMLFLILTANVSSSLLYSLNKPDLVFYIDIVSNAVYFSSLFFFASYGMVAILLTYSSYVIYKTITLQFYANKQLLQSFLSYFKELTVPVLASLGMFTSILAFQILETNLEITSKLLFSILIGAVVFSLISWVFAKKTLVQLKNALLKGQVQGIKTNKIS